MLKDSNWQEADQLATYRVIYCQVVRILLVICALLHIYELKKNKNIVMSVGSIALHGQFYFYNNFVTWSVAKEITMIISIITQNKAILMVVLASAVPFSSL